MVNSKKVPEIRFSGFSDPWEQRKFSDVVEIGSGMDYKHLGIGDIPVYGTGGYMLSVDVALSENNDAIGIGRKGTIDKPYILRAPFWTVDTLFYCIPKYNHNLDFTNCLFQNVDWKNKDESTGVPSLSKVIINNIETSIPSYEEQKKIGEYFKSFENLITLHQRKLEKLKTFKKAMLDKMFPKNGELVPEIRFSGFSDPWEQRKLDDITDVRDGTHDSPQYLKVGHPFITSKNVKDGFINYEDIQYVSDRDFEEINKRSKVDKNDILMGMIGTIGNIALVREAPDFAIKNIALIKDIGKVFYSYLYHCLQSNSVVHQLDENLDGGTQKFIALNKIRELVIPVPSEYEQHKIGECMGLLDNLITLHQRKLEKLQNIKKSMLNKMFI